MYLTLQRVARRNLISHTGRLCDAPHENLRVALHTFQFSSRRIQRAADITSPSSADLRKSYLSLDKGLNCSSFMESQNHFSFHNGPRLVPSQSQITPLIFGHSLITQSHFLFLLFPFRFLTKTLRAFLTTPRHVSTRSLSKNPLSFEDYKLWTSSLSDCTQLTPFR